MVWTSIDFCSLLKSAVHNGSLGHFEYLARLRGITYVFNLEVPLDYLHV